jgi:hypothetical protein
MTTKKLLDYVDAYINVSVTEKYKRAAALDIDSVYLRKESWDKHPYLLGYYHFGQNNSHYDHRVLEYSDITQFSEEDAVYFDVDDKSTIIDIEGLLLAHPEILLGGDDSEIFCKGDEEC